MGILISLLLLLIFGVWLVPMVFGVVVWTVGGLLGLIFKIFIGIPLAILGFIFDVIKNVFLWFTNLLLFFGKGLGWVVSVAIVLGILWLLYTFISEIFGFEKSSAGNAGAPGAESGQKSDSRSDGAGSGSQSSGEQDDGGSRHRQRSWRSWTDLFTSKEGSRSWALTVFGLTPPVTPEQIRDRYRQLVKENHPDRVDGDRSPAAKRAAEKRMQEINTAHEILTR